MKAVKHLYPLFPSGIILLFLFNLNGFSADFYKERENALKPGRFQLGFFQVFPRITLENAGYTDNVYGYDAAPQPGWMADLGIRIKAAAVLGRRLVLVLDGHPYYSYFSAEETERSFNHTFKADAYTRLGGIHLAAGVDFNSRRSRPNHEFAARIRNSMKKYRLEADFGNHTALFLTLYAAQSETKYDDDGFLSEYNIGTRLNRREREAGMKINLPVFTATLLSLQAELREYEFESLDTRNGRSLTTTLKISFPEIGKLKGDASLGYRFFYPDSPEYRDSGTFYGKGSIIYRFMRRWRLGLRYELDNYFSFLNPEQYFNDRSLELGLDYYISRNLRFGGGYTRGINIYRLLENSEEQFRDAFQRYEARLVFRLTSNTGVGISFRREEWDSERFGMSRNFYFVGGYVTHDF